VNLATSHERARQLIERAERAEAALKEREAEAAALRERAVRAEEGVAQLGKLEF
jgi:hypothetical protein